jgi:uncharacterized protein HemY
MLDVSPLGRALIIAGIVIAVIGIAVTFGAKLSWLGRLPGDVYIHKKNLTIILPITTSILISVIISAIFFLLNRR